MRPSAPSPSPSPAPAPAPAPANPATRVPFDLTESWTFDVHGWDSWPSAPTPSTIGFRWDAALNRYEVLAPGHGSWSRLEHNLGSGGAGHYDVYAGDGTKHPFYMYVVAPGYGMPPIKYVSNARIFEGNAARAYFAFGLATEPGDVPVGGTMTCTFGEDEIGWGILTIDLAAGTVSGAVAPFWANVQYPVQTSFTPGATTISATFGTGGVMDARFFGPGAANIAVRANGGGQSFAAVRGIMTGLCR